MEARNRLVPEWFHRLQTGQVRLPRFQRGEAWGHTEVSGLLETVLRGLPSGAALILEVGARELFHSRSLVGAPQPTERVVEHLLDGQQRLTALWRSFHDNYEDRQYFVYFEPDDDHAGEIVPRVEGLSRSIRNGVRYPVWADSAAEVYEREYIPLRLLSPGDNNSMVEEWINAATGDDRDAWKKLTTQIQRLRAIVAAFNLPFLSLPAGTPKDVALDVFIKMNTSSVHLSPFDIVVAEVEESSGQSLHDLISHLKERVPAVEAYADAPELALNVAAMREDRPPSKASSQQLDCNRLVNEWTALESGIAFTIGFLEEERIFDADRLPTSIVLSVISAIHDFLPPALDARGQARTLLRKYLWRASLTRRYEKSANTRALQDLRGLVSILRGHTDPLPPIFDETEYPLPTVEELKDAGWPKKRDILARGILAVAMRGGGLDIADGTPISRAHLTKREYHHLFPDALLSSDGDLASAEINLALNCALISLPTNRNIAAKEPVRYLKERTDRAAMGEEEVLRRLQTHTVPWEYLNVGGYQNLEENIRMERIRLDYEAFLDARASLLHNEILKLCNGVA